MENLTINSSLAAAHSNRGSLGQAQLARTMARLLAGPCQRAHLALCRGQSGTVASSLPAKRRRKPKAFQGGTVTR
jgi:hypothetical protein